MLASEPPRERNASEWLVESPTFQALNVYDPHDFGEKTLRNKLSAWDETLCGAKGHPNWRLKLRKAEKCLMSFWSRANVHMTAIYLLIGSYFFIHINSFVLLVI
jgi:hypothetical protein